PKTMLVPRSSFEQRMSVLKLPEQKLTMLRDEIAMQVPRCNSRIRTQLMHRRRVLDNAEPQQPGLIPDLDRFDEWSCREFAVADCARPGAFDSRAHRIGDTRFEVPLIRRRQLRKRNYVLPYLFRCRRDLDRGRDSKDVRSCEHVKTERAKTQRKE